MKTVTTPQTLLEAVNYFTNEKRCVEFLARFRWTDGKPVCPKCGSLNICHLKTRPSYRCRETGCKSTFSLKTGSIMESSPLPITKWVPALWFVINHKNGVSSYEVSRALGITQKAAWHLNHRIRKAISNGSFAKMGKNNPVEIDETFIGGKEQFKHRANKPSSFRKRGHAGKIPVMGMVERQGEVRAKVVDNVRRASLEPEVLANVEKGATIYTDSLMSYQQLAKTYAHNWVDHSKGTYVDGLAHTNTMENFWSCFKRTLKGTYIHMASFHIDRYLDEQSFRYNYRKLNDAGRFETVIPKIFGEGKKLSYAELTGRLAA
jgi:transposase-like protein